MYVVETEGFSDFDIIFFFLSLVFHVICIKPCCKVHSSQGSLWLALMWEQVCSWYLALGCCQNKVPGSWCRQSLFPGFCSFVSSSEILYLLLSALVAKSNVQHCLLGYNFQGKIIKHAFSLGNPAGAGNLLFRKSRCSQRWKIKCQYDVEGLFGMNLRWPHWAVKPRKSLY